MRTATRLVAAAGVALAAVPAEANPADIFGLGARGAAMGGAQVASVNDTTASYYNPARLGFLRDIHLDVGYQLGVPMVRTGDRLMSLDRSSGLVLGLAVPGQLGSSRLTVGASVFLPDQHITRTRSLPTERPRFIAYDNRPHRLLIAATAGLELAPGLAVGGGMAFMAGTEGSVYLRGVVGFPDAESSDLDLAIDVSLKTKRYPHLGVAWQPTPWLSLGASYRGEFFIGIDQSFDIRGDVGSAEAPIVEDGSFYLRSLSEDLFQPEQVTLGGAVQVTVRTEVELDLTFQRWSGFRNPSARIDIALDVGQFNDLVMLEPPRALPQPHLHDVVVPRLGVEHVAGRDRQWAYRGGYTFEPAVAGTQVGESNFIDNHKHTLSLGLGRTWRGLGAIVPKPFSVDGFVALTWLVPRDHDKLDALDPVGDYRSSGAALSAGVSSRWSF